MKKILLLVTIFSILSVHGQISLEDYRTKTDSMFKIEPSKKNLEAFNALAFQGKYQDYELTDSVADYILEHSNKKDFESINAFAYKLKGIISDEKGLYENAIEYYLKAIKKYQIIGSKVDVAKCEANIGFIFYHQRNKEKTLEYMMSASEVFREEGFDIGTMKVYTTIGHTLVELEQADSGLYYLKEAEAIMKRLNIFDPSIYGSFGIAYSLMDDFQQAEENYLKCIRYLEKNSINPKDYKVWYFNYAELLKRIGKYEEALKYLNISKEITGNNIYTRESYSLYNILATVNFKLGNFKESALNFSTLNAINDSIYRIDNSRLTDELAEKYQSEKKELMIANLNNEKKIEQEKRKAEEQKVYYLYLGGILLIVIILVALISIIIKIRDSKKIKAKNKLIQHQKELVEEKNKEITDSIQYAKRLQDAILPTIKLVKSYFKDSFVLFRPKDIVSGDFYWMEQKEDLTFFAVADCTGHGVPGAMVSVVCANALNKSLNEIHLNEPAAILNETRKIVVETFSKANNDVKDGMDISICAFDNNTHQLQWAGANNPLWIIRKGTSEIESIKPDKQPIGMFGESKPFTPHLIKINEGDIVYLFSDGFTDQFGGERGKKLKSSKFKELLLSIKELSMDEQKVFLDNTFDTWKGELEQIDDVCVIGVRL